MVKVISMEEAVANMREVVGFQVEGPAALKIQERLNFYNLLTGLVAEVSNSRLTAEDKLELLLAAMTEAAEFLDSSIREIAEEYGKPVEQPADAAPFAGFRIIPVEEDDESAS